MGRNVNKKQPAPARSTKPWESAKGAGGSIDDPMAVRFVESLSYDRRLYKHDIAGSIAHAQMLTATGLITEDDLAQIRRGLENIQQQIDEKRDNWPGWQLHLEDVHMCIEAALIDATGDAGRKLQTGRSRNDQVALDLRLWISDASGEIESACLELMRSFVQLARRDGQIVMPAYTHLQRAQPVVVGGELLAWVTAFERGKNRVALLREFDDFNPLGSGAVAGSCLPLDRDLVGKILRPQGWTASANAIDSTANRDGAIDFVFAICMLAMTLSRWAEQWIIYATTEFGFLELDGRYTTGSSMMPQKKNPDMLELIRGRTGGVYGQLVALLTICKGLPIGYNRDLQEDKRCVFAAYDTVIACLAMAARIVGTSRFNAEAIGANLNQGFLDATSLAEYLVTKHVPFRSAHQVVGNLVRRCEGEGLVQLSDLPWEAFDQACVDAGLDPGHCGKDVYQWLGADNVVTRYQTTGNAGRSGFDAQLSQWQERLEL